MSEEEKIEQQEKLSKFQEKLRNSLISYSQTKKEIDDNFASYKGTREIKNPITGKKVKGATNVRRMTYELIESQIDSNIPQPKVTARDNKNDDNAKTIEDFTKSELDRMPFEKYNDKQERVCPIAGGSVFLVEWDNSQRSHTSIGELKVTVLDSRCVIPEQNVTDIEDMNYLFLQLSQTKELIKRKYGVTVTDNTQEDAKENIDIVTHNFCYYKDEEGKIGIFSWVGNQIIQDMPNYFARKDVVCKKCETKKSPESEICIECGNNKFKKIDAKSEKIKIPQEVSSINQATGEIEVRIEDIEVEVPYYELNQFPIAIRSNVSEIDSFLGGSDASVIKDQQRDINIFSTKIREKLLKPGTVVFASEGIDYKPTDEEFQVVKKKKTTDSLTVTNLEGNIQPDLVYRDNEYQAARQTLGITDSFQGRNDPTATSGKAKEYAANQTAGRLASKRIMKNACYAELYELMFKFMLAYADEPRTYRGKNEQGQDEYKQFNKVDFIEKDVAGEYYYNDRYIFSTDASATLSTNRQAMWQEIRSQFTTGAYGNTQDIQTLIDYWGDLDLQHYPGAKRMLRRLEERKKQQEERAAMLNGINNNLNINNLQPALLNNVQQTVPPII